MTGGLLITFPHVALAGCSGRKMSARSLSELYQARYRAASDHGRIRRGPVGQTDMRINLDTTNVFQKIA